MSTPNPDSADFDVTVRIGCNLVYEVTGSATLLLNVKPRPDRRHTVIEEQLTLGQNLRVDEFDDSHGNRVYRLALPAGRHNRLVCTKRCAHTKLAWKCGPKGSRAYMVPGILRPVLCARVSS